VNSEASLNYLFNFPKCSRIKSCKFIWFPSALSAVNANVKDLSTPEAKNVRGVDKTVTDGRFYKVPLQPPELFN
jgi:hypothetical protein